MPRRILLSALCVAALAFPGCTTVSISADEPTEELRPLPADPDAVESVTLSITGMTCAVICPREVRRMLLSAPGVLRVRIDWEEREASCTVMRGTDPQTLLEALRSPYAARVVN